jgi:hypothetical protein
LIDPGTGGVESRVYEHSHRHLQLATSCRQFEVGSTLTLWGDAPDLQGRYPDLTSGPNPNNYIGLVAIGYRDRVVLSVKEGGLPLIDAGCHVGRQIQ